MEKIHSSFEMLIAEMQAFVYLLVALIKHLVVDKLKSSASGFSEQSKLKNEKFKNCGDRRSRWISHGYDHK